MFNKDDFSNILIKINNTYDTMTEFGEKASFDRTYISKYINKKLDNPPTPKILVKLSKASNGITSYEELMKICGYIDEKDFDVYLSSQNNQYDIHPLFNIPVLGKIAAGQPILANEYLEGYLPVDPNVYGMKTHDDYFYLKVSGESMNLKVHNGDYALIHKQDYANDGDIIVAIVNGDDEATLKKYKRINENTIALEPMSTLPMEPIYVNLKETKFQIIGKAIGQFGKF